MKQLFPVIIFIWLLPGWAWGQVPISGMVVDSMEKLPLPFANVVVLTLPDSTIKGTTTDLEGQFSISVNPNTEVVVTVSFLGFDNYHQTIKVKQAPVYMGSIVLAELSTELLGVEVTVERVAVTQSGDTTMYNADSYKTNVDATSEDLITKLPGVEIIDGKVQVQGEEVTQVLVDGKPYFGDNPNAVLKNLPANFIDKVQVYDQVSDQAKFTGFNDGSATKVINIVTKPENRNGQFGKFYGGYGYDNKYSSGGMLNLFDNDRRITILAQSNNINEQNFSTVDLLGVTGSGSDRRGSKGPGLNMGNFSVNSREGITTTHAFGFNYSDKWGSKKKVDVTGSYFFNLGNTEAEKLLQRQYILPSDSGLLYNETSLTTSRNINHQFNTKLTYEIDSNNSLVIQPRLSVQQNRGNSNFYGAFSTAEGLRNDSRNYYFSDLLGLSFSNSVLYRHRFATRGRTLSVTLNNGISQHHSTSNLSAANGYYFDSVGLDSINQSTDAVGFGWSIGSNAVYTEPVGKNGQLQLRYETNYTFDDNSRNTSSFDNTTGELVERDTALSSEFNNFYISQQVGTGYMLNKNKSQLSFNVNYQWALLNSEQLFPVSSEFSRSFHTVLPDVKYKYSFSKSKSVDVNYRTMTRAPNISQLQNVLNNDNPLQLRIGNPLLRQQYQHNLTARYSVSNATNNTSFFTNVRATIIQQRITNASYIAAGDSVINGIALGPGVQLTQPVNLDGYFNLGGNVNYSFPLKPLKSKLSVSFNTSYTRSPGIVNNEINYANTPTTGIGLVLGSNISELIDFTVTSRSSLSFVSNSLRKQLNTRYFSQFTSAKITVSFWKGMVVQTEARHNLFTGLQGGFNQNFVLWNTSVAKKFLKDNRGELRLTVYDILNQNNSTRRNITELYIEDSQINVLQRYVMLTFTYNLQHFKKG